MTIAKYILYKQILIVKLCLNKEVTSHINNIHTKGQNWTEVCLTRYAEGQHQHLTLPDMGEY